MTLPLVCALGALLPADARAYDARSLASADAGFVLLDVLSDRLDNAAGRSAAWGQLFGSEQRRESDASQPAFRHEMRGLGAGYDALSGRVWRVGIAAARIDLDAVASPALAAPDLGQVALSAYVGGSVGRVSVGAGAMLSRWQYADANARGLFLAAGYDLGAQSGWRARAELRASRIDAGGDDHQRVGAGLAFIRPIELRRGGSLTPWLRGGLRWQSDTRDLFKGYAAVGASWEPTARLAVTLALEAQQANVTQGNLAQVGFSIGL